MNIESIELVPLRLPLVSPFRTSFGTEHDRNVMLVKVTTADAVGWGECVSDVAPLYSSEFTDGSECVTRDHLLPRLFACDALTADDVAKVLGRLL